jgi:TRAP-type uncharacterized transport system substrate-binding protein
MIMAKFKSISMIGAVLLAGLMTTFTAQAEPVNLYAGKSGGGYDAAMQRMSKMLQVQGISTTVVNTSGSEEIVQSVCAGKGVGIAQADAIARAQLSGCSVEVVADYNKTGEYVVYMYPTGGTDRFRDLKTGQTVATDLVGSGSDTTTRNIRQYVNEQKNPPSWVVVNLDPLAAIAAGKQGKVHGLVLVRAALNDPTFQIFQDNGWSFGEMWVDGLEEGFVSGSVPVYKEVKEKIPKVGNTWLYKVSAFYIVKGVDSKVQTTILNEAYR